MNLAILVRGGARVGTWVDKDAIFRNMAVRVGSGQTERGKGSYWFEAD